MKDERDIDAACDEEYDLISFREKGYSQYGEQGILKKIIQELGMERGTFVEFGAGDGIYLSNTKFLADSGWSGVFIEADPEKYVNLEKNYRDNDKIHTINSFICPTGETSIDNLLKKTGMPPDIDIMSIDIDGNEFHIWDSMEQYSPKVIVAETNFTFPFNVDYISKENGNTGSSALGLFNFARYKGYRFVCYNVLNAFFVRKDLAPLLKIRNRSFAYLFCIGVQAGMIGLLVSDYDGVWHSALGSMDVWGMKGLTPSNTQLVENALLFRYVDTPEGISELFKPNF